jgi:putative transposase
MSIRKFTFAPGEYYHLYNRGNSKQKIFHDAEDYKRFIGLLYACNQKNNFKSDDLKKDQGLFNVKSDKSLISIGVYCLMPNHFHLLVTEDISGDISRYMQKVITAYVMYYNKKYKRTGSLFEGKFKAQYIASDRHLKYLYAYIHLNPVKLIDSKWKEEGIQDELEAKKYILQYRYSSCLDYLDEDRVEKKVLNKEFFPSYFASKKDFAHDLFVWFKYKDEE